MNVRLFLRYDGSAYHGWQIQNKDGKSHLSTVQGALTEALCSLYGDKKAFTEPVGVSRTDAGVHADMYCASFNIQQEHIPADKICYALKQFLPDDIVVFRSEQVPDDFHARFSVISKTYKYLFYTSEFPVPCLNNRAWHVPYKGTPDLEAMKQAAEFITGTHEFDAFCAAGGSAKTTKRTIYNISVEKVSAPFLQSGNQNVSSDLALYALYVEGDGFLYNMVRIITGTVLYAGLEKILPSEIPNIIASKNRKNAGITAPAQGLYLNSLKYPY